MDLFKKAKNIAKSIKKKCYFCDKSFIPDNRNLKRGWGKCCSKSCAANLKNKYSKMSKSDMIMEKRNNILNDLGFSDF